MATSQVPMANLQVTSQPVQLNTTATKDNRAEIFLNQLATVDSGIKSMLGSVKEISQNNLREQMFRDEQEQRIKAEAERQAAAEKSAADKAAAEQKAYEKEQRAKSDLDNEAYVSEVVAAGNGDVSKPIIENLKNGNEKQTRSMATSVIKWASAKASNEVNIRSKSKTPEQLREYDSAKDYQDIFNGILSSVNFDKGLFRYVDVSAISEAQQGSYEAQQNTVSAYVSEINEQNKHFEELSKNAEKSNLTALNNETSTNSIRQDIELALFFKTPKEQTEEFKKASDVALNKMSSLQTAIANGSITPEEAKKTAYDLEKRMKETFEVGGTNYTLSFGNESKIESAFKVLYSQINAAESKNKATVKINDTKVEAFLGTIKHYSGKGDASNAVKKIEELQKSPEYNALTPEQKELVNTDIRNSEVKLNTYNQLTYDAYDRIYSGITNGDDETLAKEDAKNVKGFIDLSINKTVGDLDITKPEEFLEKVKVISIGFRNSAIASDISMGKVSRLFSKIPSSPDEFKVYVDGLSALKEANGEYFNKTLQDNPQASRAYDIGQLTLRTTQGVNDAYDMFKRSNDKGVKPDESSISYASNAAMKNIIDAGGINIKSSNADMLLRTYVTDAIKIGMTIDEAANFASDKFKNTVTITPDGHVSSVHDGVPDPDKRDDVYSDESSFDIAKLVNSKMSKVTVKNEQILKAENDWAERMKKKYHKFAIIPMENGRSRVVGYPIKTGFFIDTDEEYTEDLVSPYGRVEFETKDTYNLYVRKNVYNISREKKEDKNRVSVNPLVNQQKQSVQGLDENSNENAADILKQINSQDFRESLQ